MNVAIVHYHLNRGGVAQVIANSLRALSLTDAARDLARVVLLYGGRCEGWSWESWGGSSLFEVQRAEVAGLDYDDGGSSRSAELAGRMGQLLQAAGLGASETILHVHNHCLGKNVSLPGALALLAQDGYSLLLQIHDFAEDFRPGNYLRMAGALASDSPETLPAALYPQAPHIHYAVLNRRDHSILRDAGVAAERLHWLPNAVSDVGPLPDRSEARAKLASRFPIPRRRRFVLYPVRGIRRKNLGEALLWSILAGEEAVFGFTLPPLNPIEWPAYRRWRELAESSNLPCVFEVGLGEGLAYADNLAAADLLLTTSVAEGFGMVFLESCLAGRRLIGRDLPEITADFKSDGIELDGLNPGLWTPVDWVGRDVLRESLWRSYGEALAAYGRPAPSAAEFDLAIGELIREGQVDFACLNATIQRRLLRRLRNDPGRREEMLRRNAWVGAAIGSPDRADLLDRNAAAVRRRYNLEGGGRRLMDVYRKVAASKAGVVTAPAAGERILNAFLHLSRFHPIRTER